MKKIGKHTVVEPHEDISIVRRTLARERRERVREEEAHAKRTEAVEVYSLESDSVHALTWNWTTNTILNLDKIAKNARDAAKNATSLADKMAMRDVERKAVEARLVVAGIFGKTS